MVDLEEYIKTIEKFPLESSEIEMAILLAIQNMILEANAEIMGKVLCTQSDSQEDMRHFHYHPPLELNDWFPATLQIRNIVTASSIVIDRWKLLCLMHKELRMQDDAPIVMVIQNSNVYLKMYTTIKREVCFYD